MSVCMYVFQWLCLSVCHYEKPCLHLSCSSCKCVLCSSSSGQAGNWGKQLRRCRSHRRPRPRGEPLSTPTWLSCCLHMFCTSSRRVWTAAAKLARWRAWREIAAVTCAVVTFIALQKRGALVPASPVWSFPSIVINIMSVLGILFGLAACLCASLPLCVQVMRRSGISRASGSRSWRRGSIRWMCVWSSCSENRNSGHREETGLQLCTLWSEYWLCGLCVGL